MKRDYKDGVKDNITFFTGVEIERTPAYGMKTLFVVGVHDPYTILDIVKESRSYTDQSKHITHIYFGANQSFKTKGVNDVETWRPWENMIYVCLDSEYDLWCTLDFDICETEGLLESGLTEKRRFIPQISVKLPYIQQLGYNATLKIDDKDFKASNPGVWCHNLQDLLGRDRFTNWDQYGKDEIIK
jgi:hypothetical protein